MHCNVGVGGVSHISVINLILVEIIIDMQLNPKHLFFISVFVFLQIK